MIGATTENPYFEVNSALLSRGRVVELEHLKDEDIATLIERALEAPQGLNGKFSADEDVVKTICALAAGDARSGAHDARACERDCRHSSRYGRDASAGGGGALSHHRG